MHDMDNTWVQIYIGHQIYVIYLHSPKTFTGYHPLLTSILKEEEVSSRLLTTLNLLQLVKAWG